MIGRRIAAWIWVLLAHALMIYWLLDLESDARRLPSQDALASQPITLVLQPLQPFDAANDFPTLPAPRVQIAAPEVAVEIPAKESSAITTPERVDWPVEGKKSVARVLAAEAEAERVAKMFAGPGGTWASLTERQRSKLKKFRWKAGVDGLEKDSSGNVIYRLPDGCFLVNFSFIGCALGKAKVHGDLFKDMRLYFDELRLPQTDEGNGTEPGAQPLP